jgi:hypothetical protein
MKRFGKKRLLTVGLAVALVLGIGGAAFAYWTSSGAGTGSAQDATLSPLLIDQLGGTPMYNSTVDPTAYQYSYAYYATQAGELGNKVTLAGGGGPLSDVVVAMVNFNASSGPMNITFNIYNPGTYSGPGSSPGSLIATDEQSFVVPNAPSGGYDGTYCTGVRTTDPNSLCGLGFFNIEFNFSSQNITLPSTVVYGIQYNDPQSDVNGGVNVQLANENTQVTVGTDADPGYLFTDLASVAGGNGYDHSYNDVGPGEITCSTVSTTFGEYSTASCDNGNEGLGTPPYVPAVEIDTSTMSDLYPGGPAQPINLSVTNPGTAPAALNTVSIAISSITNQHSSAGPACDPSWYTIVPPSVIDGSVAAGQTWIDSPSGATIELTNIPSVDQDACQGATVNLNFTSN